jgi:hypothetical protein
MSISTDALAIPEGYTLHSENSAHILLPASADAFLNPVQEFNRDLSVACIRVWSEELNREKEAKWRKNIERNNSKERKGKKARGEPDNQPVHVKHLRIMKSRKSKTRVQVAVLSKRQRMKVMCCLPRQRRRCVHLTWNIVAIS